MSATASAVDLVYGIAPPAVVYTTTEASNPVSNELEFDMFNPSDNALVTLSNPTGLTPDDDLPPLAASAKSSPLDRIYVWFPWGDAPGDLCTAAEAAGIALAALEADWYAAASSDPVHGRYWILFPKTTSELEAQQSRGFSLSGVVSLSTQDAPETMTVLYTQPRIHGRDLPLTTTQVYKRVPTVTIESFDASALSVALGAQVVLSWTTLAAKSCTLDPGQTPVPVHGSQTVEVQETTTYTLTATGYDGKPVSRPVTVSVVPVAISSFTASPTDPVPTGTAVTLAWTTDYASGAAISPSVGTVPPVGTTQVEPTETTAYTLTANGLDGPKTAQATASVITVSITSFTAAETSVAAGTTVELTWATEYATDATLYDDDSSRSYAVDVNGSAMVLVNLTTTFTLTCTGPNGPVSAPVAVQATDVPAISGVGTTEEEVDPGTTSLTVRPTLENCSSWELQISVSGDQVYDDTALAGDSLQANVASAPVYDLYIIARGLHPFSPDATFRFQLSQ